MGLCVFGQYRGSDSKNTEKFGPIQPLFHVKALFSEKLLSQLDIPKYTTLINFRALIPKIDVRRGNSICISLFSMFTPCFHKKRYFDQIFKSSGIWLIFGR